MAERAMDSLPYFGLALVGGLVAVLLLRHPAWTDDNASGLGAKRGAIIFTPVLFVLGVLTLVGVFG